jgi:hypothetical protein
MERQKCPQIALRDPDDTAYAVRDELAGLDPPPDCPGRDVETIGDLGDREKSDLIVAVTAATGMAESNRVIAVAEGSSSRAHADSPSRGGMASNARWNRALGTKEAARS